jgi:2,3-dihydroxybenzoate decarboxylase
MMREQERHRGNAMQGKIALEEHFAIAATLGDSKVFGAHVWETLGPRLLDIEDMRLAEMDRHGVAMMILSLNAPAVQAIHDVKRAILVAKEANDVLAAHVRKRPDRFAAFAALPMQDVDAAIAELTRCVDELGFVGALVNGFSQAGAPDGVLYYDAPQYRPFWRAVERLDVPFYLHPRNPLPSWSRIYAGHDWLLGPNWAFAAETAVHALRLIGSGLFDECPKLQIVLGHLGEGIPVQLWRIDGRNGWMKEPHRYAAKHGVGHYFRRHFHVTTSGNFHTPSLVNAIAELGPGRVMFSVDWPFESVGEGCGWFDKAEIGAADRAKIGRDNAVNLFKLKAAGR